jgi:hypothetical protein
VCFPALYEREPTHLDTKRALFLVAGIMAADPGARSGADEKKINSFLEEFVPPRLALPSFCEDAGSLMLLRASVATAEAQRQGAGSRV